MAEDEDEEAGPPGLPPGTPFYMTPAGHAALQDELRRLWSEERPRVVEVVSWAAGLGDRSENADYQYGKRRLREIDRRLFFGATVTYLRADDSEVTVPIVGVDEADTAKGRISWVAPVARALLGKRVGDLVRLRAPQGTEEIEVVAIRYPDA